VSVAVATGASNTIQTPQGWRIAQLGHVAEVVGGSTPSRTRPEYWGGDIPWVVPSELTELAGRYLQDSRESITADGLKFAGLRILPVGSVLLTTRATVGLAAINALPVTTNQGFQSLVAKNGTDNLWLYYCISSKRRELEQRGAGSTFREVSRDGVRTLPILLPPLSEQRAIAAVLDSIDKAIERTDEVVAATERLREALLHELLTRGLPGQHSEWKEVPGVGTIPASWKISRLGDVCDRPKYGANAPALPFDYNLPRYVRITDIADDGRLLSEDRRSADPNRTRGFELNIGDMLFARSGSVGRTYLHRSGNGRCVYAGYLIRFRALPGVATPEYLERWTRSEFYGRWVRSMQRSGAQPNINATEYSSLPILLPPLPEQRAIAAVLDSVDAAIERARQERCELRSLQASTADALLTGRVRTIGC